jgi:hypothetical protein
MAIAVDWPTKVFSVPQGDLTLVSGTLYEMDTETDFRQLVNAIMASEEGIVFDDPISHNTQYSVAGVVYARKVELINGYSLRFTPDSQWSVRLAGSNNNLFDVENGVLVQNQVQVIAQNSAGLQVVTQGSGVTEQDKLDIADRVWDEDLISHLIAGSGAALLKFLVGMVGGRWKIIDASPFPQLIHYEEDGVTEIRRYDLKDAAGNAIDISKILVFDKVVV